MSETLANELLGTLREAKPRERGMTLVSDQLSPMNNDLLEQTADCIDFIRFDSCIPFMVDGQKLLARIRQYHDLGIKVMSDGTLLEIAVQRGVASQVLATLRALGFDLVEVSESIREMSIDTKKALVEEASKLSMDYVFAVGRRGSKGAASVAHMTSKVQEAIELKSRKVIIEAGEREEEEQGSGRWLYEARGALSWDELNELAGRFGPPKLIFEAPRISQRTALILEFGPAVNLSGVPIEGVLTLEMQRLGLTAETFGLSRPVQNIEGSPAAKFVYHLIRSEHPVDQAALIQRSGLPKRTLQAALGYLIDHGFIREVPEPSDMRRHKYTLR